MKSVLMIAYAYPPILTVGRNRILRFERYLRAFGYEPIIHTVRNPDRVRTRTSAGPAADATNVYRSYAVNLGWLAAIVGWIGDKIARLFGADLQRDPLRRLLFFPDVHIGWIPHCVVTSLRIIRQERVSAIFVTCSPFSAVISGLILKAITKLPLVLDFRDPWSFNDHNVDSAYLRWMIRRVERRAMRACDAFIANTATSAQAYRELYPQYAARITHIYNGVNTPPTVESKPASSFTLLYVGALYNPEYLDLLFSTAKEALGTRDYRIEFAGFESAILTKAIVRHQMQDRVVLHGFIQDPIELQRIYGAASALLYYNGFTDDGRLITSVVRAKLYDYLATGVPILAIAPRGEVSDLLERYSPGSLNVAGDLHSGNLPTAFLQALEEMHVRWQQGELIRRSNAEFARMFGGEELTRQLSVVLDRLTTPSQPALARESPANDVR